MSLLGGDCSQKLKGWKFLLEIMPFRRELIDQHL